MTGLLLHVGFPKTATTFLQQTVWPTVVGLDLVGPPTRNPERMRLRRDLLALRDGALSPGSSERLRRLGERGSAVPTVVSLESLVGDVFNGCATRRSVATRLATVFPGATVLVTIRSQRSLLRSLYSQFVAQGGTTGPGPFFAGRAPGAEAFSAAAFRFDEAVELYDSLFGRDSVAVVAVEEMSTVPIGSAFGAAVAEGLVAEEVRVQGMLTAVREAPESAVPPDFAPLNVALPAAACRILRWSNATMRRSPFNNAPVLPVRAASRVRNVLATRPLRAVLGAFGPSSVALPWEVEDALAAWYHESNHRLGARLDRDLHSLGYP